MLYSAVPTAIVRGVNYIKFHSRRHQPDERCICLTFDDGPSREYTPELLALLRRYEVKATFFVVGEFAEQNPDIISQMKADGHDVGLHSLKHKFGMLQGPSAARSDFRTSYSIVRSLGVEPHMIRPPWGTVNLELLKEIQRKHLKMVLWSVMAGDWQGNIDSECIVRRLRHKVKPGSLICLHDGRGENGAPARTIRALEKMLPEWKTDGYKFVKVDELYERRKQQ